MKGTRLAIVGVRDVADTGLAAQMLGALVTLPQVRPPHIFPPGLLRRLQMALFRGVRCPRGRTLVVLGSVPRLRLRLRRALRGG